MIIIINGAPGSGKTSTAKLLFENTNNSAFIDGDWLLATTPHDHTEQRHLRYKNIASVARNYYKAGFSTVFISFVYVNQEDLSAQIDLLKDLTDVKVFALICNEEILRKRHSEDSHKREEIESSIDLNKKIAALDNVEIINNSNISVEEAANKIKHRLSLT